MKVETAALRAIQAGGGCRFVLLASACLVAIALSSPLAAQDASLEEDVAHPADDIAQPAEDIAEPAEDIAQAEDQGYAENAIVVTATKREQTLQEVPLAVQVVTGETIERAQIRDLKDLQSLVPTLRVTQLQSSANTNFIIRGFGNGANNAGIEPSVGVFIDNVYRSRTAAQISDLPDLRRIEVLSGPQSTLFGKNASAGVISIVTAEPRFELGGSAELSYGNYDAVVAKALVTGPLSETVAVSLAGGFNKRDGYVRDLGTGGWTNDRDRWFVRAQALLRPQDNLKVRLIGDYDKIDEICCAVVNLRASSATAALRSPLVGGNVNDPGDRFGGVVYSDSPSSNTIENYGVSGQIDYALGPLTLTSITAYRQNNPVTNQDSDFTSAALLGRNSQDLRIRTFTQEVRLATDIEGPVNVLLGGFYFNESVRQENQLLYGSDVRPYANILVQGASGGALTVPSLESTIGALDGEPGRYSDAFFRNGDGLNERYSLNDDSWSVFGQVEFAVAEGVTLTAGVNYTKDKKRFTASVDSSDVFSSVDLDAAQYAPLRNALLRQGVIQQQVGARIGVASPTQAQIGAFAAANPDLFAGIAAGATAFANANEANAAANPLAPLRAFQFLPPFLEVPNRAEDGRLSDDDLSYTLRAAWDVTETVNVYASYATGFKPSSVNLSRDSRPTEADRQAIIASGRTIPNLGSGSRFAGPEESEVFELGLKGEWDVASLSIAAFKQIITGFQSNIFTGTGFRLANAGKESVLGFEFTGTVRPVEGLSLGMAVVYLEPEYDEFRNSAFGDISGSRPAGIPELSATFGVDYAMALADDNRLIFHGDFHYEEPVQIVDGLPGFNSLGPTAAFDAARPFRREVNDLNASLTLALANGMELSAWGRNILSDRYLLSVFDSTAQPFSVSGYPNQPRTYGVTARYKF